MKRIAIAFIFASACASSSSSVPAVPAGPPQIWSYEVEASDGTLSISAELPAGSSPELVIDRGMDRFVSELSANGRPAHLAHTRVWRIAECSSGCGLRYRFDLAGAAASIDDVMFARSFEDGTIVAPPSSWLIRPASFRPGTRYRFRVKTHGDLDFVSGVFRSPDGSWEAGAGHLARAPFSAFGRFRAQSRELQIGSGTIELAIGPGAFALGDRALADWVAQAADNVTHYYGRFPVARALVLVIPTKGRGFGSATTLGNGGASIFVEIGEHTPESALEEDWQMTHEMVHLAFPNLARNHRWLEEGIATYVEPLARVRNGRLSRDSMWRSLMRGLPQGLPRAGDRGLDRTPTWGRTYWGGALFCLLADLEIRKQTANTRSLDDALRAILAKGGDVTVGWSLERTLDEGDRATGTTVLHDLHARMGSAPVGIDLDALWESLGVRANGREIELDDAAPLAEIRSAMTARTAAAQQKEHTLRPTLLDR